MFPPACSCHNARFCHIKPAELARIQELLEHVPTDDLD
jgi:hypothetical protein